MLPLSALFVAIGCTTRLDHLDTYVMTQMARRQVAGLSLAIVQDG